MAPSDVRKSHDALSLSAALKSTEKDKWTAAIHEELYTLEFNKTWTKVDNPPQYVSILPSGFLLMLARDSPWKPARCKDHLVASDNFQSAPVYYVDLYTPGSCIDLVYVFLSMAVVNHWSVEPVYVKVVFLHANLPTVDKIWA